MLYQDGQKVMPGDHVDIGGNMKGIVMCSLDDKTSEEGFPIEHWMDLKEGIIVSSPEAGIIHYPKYDPSLTLIRRR